VFQGVQTRHDFNARAKAFKKINTVLSKQVVLDVNLASKAMPDSQNTDGKKRTLANKKSKFVNLGGIVFDPKQKYEPGKIFKHYTTAEERFMVLSGLDTDKPNWGWVTPSNVSYQQMVNSRLNKPKVNITKYKRDLRTGSVIENTGIKVKVSPLGETIKDKLPGGSIMHAAAKAGGLIVDALGKLRCPPGTPAANQFTDHMGTNCFGDLAGDTETIMNEVANFSNDVQGLASQSRSVIPGSISNPNASSQEIFDELRRNNPRWTPEYENAVMKFIDMRSRMELESKERQKAVEHLSNLLGLNGVSSDRNQDLHKIMESLLNSGMLRDDFDVEGMLIKAIHGHNLSQDEAVQFQILAQINSKFVEENATIEDKLKGHEAFFVYQRFIEMGINHADAVKKTRQYYSDKSSGTKNKEIKSIDFEVQRMWEQQRGILSSFSQLVLEDPDRAKNYRFEINYYPNENVHAESIPEGRGLHTILINPFDVLHNPPVEKIDFDEALIFSVDPGPPYTDQQKQMAIARATAQYQFLKTVSEMYAFDLPEALGGGQSSKGSQLFWHEFSHTLQWDAIEKDLNSKNKILSTMTNDEISQELKNAIIPETSRYKLDNLTGHTTESLIESRLDILAGAYSNDEQSKIINAIQQHGDTSAQFERARRITELETAAELYAQRRMGIISGSDIDDALEWMDRQKARPQDWQSTIPQPGNSLAPGVATSLGIPIMPSTNLNGGNPRPGRTSTIASLIREGKLTPEDIEMEIARINSLPWGQTTNGGSGVKNRFVQTYLEANFPNQGIEFLTDDEILKLVDACQEEAKRLREKPKPLGPSIDTDSLNGWKDSQNGASQLDKFSDKLQDIIDLRSEYERQTGPTGTPVVRTDASGKPVKRASAYAGKPGEAHKELKKAFDKGNIDQETLYEMANDYKNDLTEDEYKELIELSDWDPIAEAAKTSIDDDGFWDKGEDEIPDDPFAEEDPTKDPFSLEYIKPKNSTENPPQNGDRKKKKEKTAPDFVEGHPWDVSKIPPVNKLLGDEGLASAARMHAVSAQRVLTPREQFVIKDSIDSSQPIGGISSGGLDIEDVISQSASRRRILTDAGIKIEDSDTTPSRHLTADKNIETILNPLLDAMDKTPTSREMAVQLHESDFDGIPLLNGSEIQHSNFAVGSSPSNKKQGLLSRGRPVVVEIPKGSRIATQGQGKGKEPKIIIPPGSIKIIENPESGKIRARIVDQHSSSDILENIKRRVSKSSANLDGDSKREASKIIDSIDKVSSQRNARGEINNQDMISRQIGQRNSNIIIGLTSKGSSPFGISVPNNESNPQSNSEAFMDVNKRVGTTLGESLDSRHSSYKKRISGVINEMRNKNSAVVENPIKLSRTTDSVLNKYKDNEIKNLISDFGAQVHMGVNKNLVVPIDDLSQLGENQGIFRNVENDSIEMLKRQNDILNGFSPEVKSVERPIQAEVRHAQHDNDIAELLKQKGSLNASPEFYSESNSIKAVLRKETSSRSGYGYKDFVKRDTPLIPVSTKDRKLIDTGISDNAKNSDSIDTQKLRLNEILDGAVTGNHSAIVGTKDNPSLMAMIPGGVNKREIVHIEYPLSRLNINSESIDNNDLIMGKKTISSQLKTLGMTDAEIEKFFNSGGLIGGGPTPPLAMRLAQFKEAQNTKNELRKYGINKIKFVNPEGLDIENPRTWQNDKSALTESAQRLLENGAAKQIKSHLASYAESAMKQRKKAM
jgi:hypothetical protein